MSYDLYLVDPVTKETLELAEPHYLRGGTYQMGGTTELWLNVTYNYGFIFRKENVLGSEGIQVLENKTGAESIPLLEKAIANLSDDIHPDYWEPTAANAIKPLYQLMALAKMRPDYIWDGD